MVGGVPRAVQAEAPGAWATACSVTQVVGFLFLDAWMSNLLLKELNRRAGFSFFARKAMAGPHFVRTVFDGCPVNQGVGRRHKTLLSASRPLRDMVNARGVLRGHARGGKGGGSGLSVRPSHPTSVASVASVASVCQSGDPAAEIAWKAQSLPRQHTSMPMFSAKRRRSLESEKPWPTGSSLS